MAKSKAHHEHTHHHYKQKSHGLEQEQTHDEFPDTTSKHKGLMWILIIVLIVALTLLFAFYSLPKIFR